MRERLRRDALDVVRAAIAGVNPARLVARALTGAPGSTLAPFEGVYVCAAGKASGGMLRAFSEWAGPAVRGTLVARGSHPTPDRESVRAAEVALDFARWTDARVALVLLLSGGASSMMAMPAGGVTLEEKAAVGRMLLAAGAPIHELNAVRKHLSAIKGGRLGARAFATCTLAISDVTGAHEDDPAVIGSGPGVPDETTYAGAVDVLQRHEIWDAASASIRRHLDRGRRGTIEETPKPGDDRLARAVAYVIGGRRDAMASARARAEGLAYRTIVVDEAVGGEASEAGPALVARLLAVANRGEATCFISSGETTVKVRGQGRGGRNQELALSAVEALERSGRAAVLVSAGTDGVDGPTDAAGGIVDWTSAPRARAMGLDLRAALLANDSHPALEALGDLLTTGPTGTNVGDVQILLVR
jgi:glycerate-2-kinase